MKKIIVMFASLVIAGAIQPSRCAMSAPAGSSASASSVSAAGLSIQPTAVAAATAAAVSEEQKAPQDEKQSQRPPVTFRGELLRTMAFPVEVFSIAALPGGWFAAGFIDGMVKIWDEKGVLRQTINVPGGYITVLKTRKFTSGSGVRMRYWFSESLCKERLYVTAVVALAGLSSGRLVSVSPDSSIRIWDIETGNCMQTLEWYGSKVTSLVILSDGRIALGSENGEISIYNGALDRCIQILVGHASKVNAIAAFSDGQRLASGSSDCTIKIWNVETGACTKTLKISNDAGGIFGLATLPDDRLVSTAMWNVGINIWDIATGTCTECKGAAKDSHMATLTDGRIVVGGTYRVSKGIIEIWR